MEAALPDELLLENRHWLEPFLKGELKVFDNQRFTRLALKLREHWKEGDTALWIQKAHTENVETKWMESLEKDFSKELLQPLVEKVRKAWFARKGCSLSERIYPLMAQEPEFDALTRELATKHGYDSLSPDICLRLVGDSSTQYLKILAAHPEMPPNEEIVLKAPAEALLEYLKQDSRLLATALPRLFKDLLAKEKLQDLIRLAQEKGLYKELFSLSDELGFYDFQTVIPSPDALPHIATAPPVGRLEDQRIQRFALHTSFLATKLPNSEAATLRLFTLYLKEPSAKVKLKVGGELIPLTLLLPEHLRAAYIAIFMHRLDTSIFEHEYPLVLECRLIQALDIAGEHGALDIQYHLTKNVLNNFTAIYEGSLDKAIKLCSGFITTEEHMMDLVGQMAEIFLQSCKSRSDPVDCGIGKYFEPVGEMLADPIHPMVLFMEWLHSVRCSEAGAHPSFQKWLREHFEEVETALNQGLKDASTTSSKHSFYVAKAAFYALCLPGGPLEEDNNQLHLTRLDSQLKEIRREINDFHFHAYSVAAYSYFWFFGKSSALLHLNTAEKKTFAGSAVINIVDNYMPHIYIGGINNSLQLILAADLAKVYDSETGYRQELQALEKALAGWKEHRELLDPKRIKEFSEKLYEFFNKSSFLKSSDKYDGGLKRKEILEDFYDWASQKYSLKIDQLCRLKSMLEPESSTSEYPDNSPPTTSG